MGTDLYCSSACPKYHGVRAVPSPYTLISPFSYICLHLFSRSSTATRKQQRESRARPWLTGSILAKRSSTTAEYRDAPSRTAKVSSTPPPSSTGSPETSFVSVSSSGIPTHSKIPRLRVAGSVTGEKSEGAEAVDDGVPGKGKRGLLASLRIGASESTSLPTLCLLADCCAERVLSKIPILQCRLYAPPAPRRADG